MAEDLVDYRRIFDRSNDLQGTGAVRAMFDVDVEDPFEQPGPAHARRFSVGSGVWTWSLLLVMSANNNFRCRKVVDFGNLFGRVWQVSTRSVHALLP